MKKSCYCFEKCLLLNCAGWNEFLFVILGICSVAPSPDFDAVGGGGAPREPKAPRGSARNGDFVRHLKVPIYAQFGARQGDF